MYRTFSPKEERASVFLQFPVYIKKTRRLGTPSGCFFPVEIEFKIAKRRHQAQAVLASPGKRQLNVFVWSHYLDSKQQCLQDARQRPREVESLRKDKIARCLCAYTVGCLRD